MHRIRSLSHQTLSSHGPNMCKQFGIGHDFIRKSTNWNWKVTSTFGLSGPLPEVRQKTLLPIFPGFDINVGWNAQYEHPDLHGYVSSSSTLYFRVAALVYYLCPQTCCPQNLHLRLFSMEDFLQISRVRCFCSYSLLSQTTEQWTCLI